MVDGLTGVSAPRLAWFDDFAPIAFLDEGAPAGRAHSILQAAISAAGLGCTFVPTPMSAAQNLFRDGVVDGFASLAIHESRRAVYDCSRTYMTTGAGFFVLRGTEPPDAGLLHGGLRVATPADGPLVSYLLSRKPAPAVLATADYREALAAVVSGEAVAAALNVDVRGPLAEAHYPGIFQLPASPFLSLPLAVAVAKGRWTGFLERLDRAL